MDISSINNKFFNEYKNFLLSENYELAKKVWNLNSAQISSSKTSRSSSEKAYNFWIFSFNLINYNLNKNLNEEEKVKFYSNIICDGKPDYSFDAIYIPDEWNIQIYDFKQWKEWLDFNDIETFKKFFIEHIEEWKRTDPNNPILIRLLEELDRKISLDNIKCDIYIIREKNIDEYVSFKNQLNELKWKTKKIKIWNINIIDWNEINNIIKKNLLTISDYNNSFYSLKVENFLNLEDGSNIITTSLFELLCFYLSSVKNKYDIFKLNIRKEKDKNVIRWNMIETIEDFPEKFFRFHNWINLTYDELNIKNNTFEFQFPQIINWCQTVTLLQKKFLKYIKIHLNINDWKNFDDTIGLDDVIKNIEKLKTAKILIKSHKTKLLDWEVDKIAEYSNNQNPIDKENLRANDLVQIIIEQFLSWLWYKYIRKEWEQREWKYIEIWTLFQLIHTCIFELPNWSKNDKNQIFTYDDSKYSYINILNNLSFEDIELIVQIYFNYSIYKNNKQDEGQKISDYYDHHIILALYHIISTWWEIQDNIDDEFENIFNIINTKILKDTKWTWFRRHVLQTRASIVWKELKYIIYSIYTFNIKINIWENEYNITELEKYKIDREYNKSINSESRLWNTTSIIKKIINNNKPWFLKEDLLLLLCWFYENFWWNIISESYYIDIDEVIRKKFIEKEWKIYLKSK